MKLTLRPLLFLGLTLLAAASCSSSSKPTPGQTCTLNTECNNPLSCTFGRCHVACNDTRDCPAGQRCVLSAAGVAGAHVCQLDSEKLCPIGSECMTPLTCAVDKQCRNHCAVAADCSPGQVCANSACAEPTEVTADGQLKIGVDSGVVSGVDAGAGSDAPMSNVDAPPTSGVGPCGVPEKEPNEMRDQSTAIANMSTTPSCLGTLTDVDFYELTAPSDPGGGYYQIAIGNVGMFEPYIHAYSVSDNGEIGYVYADSMGQNLNVFLAAAAGQKYRFSLEAFAQVGKPPAPYTMNITYTKVVDAYEPNDTRATAKPITIGTPIMAYLHDGYRTHDLELADLEDWYTVTAAAGNLTVKVENVPTNLEATITVFEMATGKMLSYTYGANAGANVEHTDMTIAPGTYQIGIGVFAVGPKGFEKATKPGEVPDSYTRPYKMTVSQ